MRKKILFLIHDLGRGGAEKVLVNLVRRMDREKFDITVLSLFGGGVNEKFLPEDITYRTVYRKAVRGNSHLMKLLGPEALHRRYIREKYDIEAAFLEGPSARIISGCPDPETRLFCWIHRTMDDKHFCEGFRSAAEAKDCYARFDRVFCVSEGVRDSFLRESGLPEEKGFVLYNTLNTEGIRRMAEEEAPEISPEDPVRLCAMGTLKEGKGFERLIPVMRTLKEARIPARLYLLGDGPQRESMEREVREAGLSDSFTFAGYQENPYRILRRCGLLICPSYAEGFSTAAAEALILGVPVVTTDVSGMREMLGKTDPAGMITKNDERSLCEAVRGLLEAPEELARLSVRAAERGLRFSDEETTGKAEEMLLG